MFCVARQLWAGSGQAPVRSLQGLGLWGERVLLPSPLGSGPVSCRNKGLVFGRVCEETGNASRQGRVAGGDKPPVWGEWPGVLSMGVSFTASGIKGVTSEELPGRAPAWRGDCLAPYPWRFLPLRSCMAVGCRGCDLATLGLWTDPVSLCFLLPP